MRVILVDWPTDPPSYPALVVYLASTSSISILKTCIKYVHTNISITVKCQNCYVINENKNCIFCCSNDSLIITNENSESFGVYCGNKTGQTVVVEGVRAVLTFHSDDNDVPKRGFLLSFNTVLSQRKYLIVDTTLRRHLQQRSKTKWI